MRSGASPRVAIVDYGMGNLFSIQQACEHVGLAAEVTTEERALRHAAAVLLPGVGAFGDAMANLRRLGFVEMLREIAASGTPFLGVCLGLQLLMSESCEFGRHEGLGIIEGDVVRFEDQMTAGTRLKVPQVGWNRIHQPVPEVSWASSPLAGLRDGEFMYFVHSYYVRPVDAAIISSVSRYGGTEFASSLLRGNVFGCQFHPERSGLRGLQIYRNLATRLAGYQAEVGRG